MVGNIYVWRLRRTDANPFIEVRAERHDRAPVGERRRWSDDFKDRAIFISRLKLGAGQSLR
jgi:hypothetical protein